MIVDYYAVLGVARDVTPPELRRAYHSRARELHPDVHPGGDATAFRELTAAYEILSDPESRYRVDRGEDPRPAPPPRPAPGRKAPDTAAEADEFVRGAVLQIVVYLGGLVLAILAFVGSCEPHMSTTTSRVVSTPTDPFLGARNSWIGYQPCRLVDPLALGLGKGVTEPNPYSTFCIFAHPPVAPGYQVSIAVGSNTVGPTTQTIGRHEVSIERPFAPDDVGGSIVQDSTMSIRVGVYATPDSGGAIGVATDPHRLLAKVLNNVESHLPPPT